MLLRGVPAQQAALSADKGLVTLDRTVSLADATRECPYNPLKNGDSDYFKS
ncbi:MAG: hypothetical protein K9J74_06055 [Sulfuritalea sp.]|nr:hypothetical protein [Sulfuritalea sp.]